MSLQDKVLALGAKVAGQALSHKTSAEALNRTLSAVQKGRKTLDEQGQKVLQQAGVATREDLEGVARRIGALRKRLQRCLDRLETTSK